MKSQIPVQREASIDGKDCVVTIVQTGKSTWKVWGDSWGRRVDATGSSEANAYSNWKAKALAMNG
ncbi:hypothetical protein [Leclercia adecarboxylata]|uniref:hypothetical protein n=1 Tax=Leclercia adecarboxylata TaxID=83655 RepID=UPI00254B8D27|nr:hypothetical protein [Leclercia adecarboxylata]